MNSSTIEQSVNSGDVVDDDIVMGNREINTKKILVDVAYFDIYEKLTTSIKLEYYKL